MCVLNLDTQRLWSKGWKTIEGKNNNLIKMLKQWTYWSTWLWSKIRGIVESWMTWVFPAPSDGRNLGKFKWWYRICRKGQIRMHRNDQMTQAGGDVDR